MHPVLVHLIPAIVFISAGQTAAAPATQPAAATQPAPAAQAASEPALQAYARGDYAAVVGLLEAPAGQAKASIQQRLILARSYLHLKRPDDALAVLKTIHADDPENPEANSLTGTILLDAGQAKDALEFLKQAHRLKKDAPSASALGRCYSALGQAAKAKPLLEEAAQQDVRNPDNCFLLGKICLDRGLGSLAEKYLLAAQEAGLDSRELHGLLLRAYMQQRKHIGPILVKRLAPAPEAGAVVADGIVLGPAAGADGQWRVAGRFCGLYEGYRLLKFDPKEPDALYAVARGWLGAGDLQRAGKCLDALLAVEPQGRRGLELRANLLIAAKDFPALEAFLVSPAAGKAFGPAELAGFYYLAGMSLRGQGQRRQALDMLAKAEKHQPTAGHVLRALGGLCKAMGKRQEAAGYYARMVELFPDAPDIDELRNTLKVLTEGKGD